MKTENTNEPIVVHEWKWSRIAVLAILVLLIPIGIIAVLTSHDARSRATLIRVSPSPLQTVMPPDDIVPPYVRLVVSGDSYGLEDHVPVDVYLDTGGTKTVELTLVMTYDGEVLEIDEQDIRSLDVYKVMQVDTNEKGTLTISLFVTAEAGQSPVATEKEKKIATITFGTGTLNTEKIEVNLDFEKGNTQKTSLIPLTDPPEQTPENILESVRGASFSITSE